MSAKQVAYVIAVLCVSVSVFCGETLKPDAYLEAVKKNSPAYLAAEEGEKAAELLLNEKTITAGAWGFAEGQYGNDKSPSSMSALYGDSRSQATLNLGLFGRTDIGLSGKVYYGISHTTLGGIQPITILPGFPPLSFITDTDYYSAKAAVELKLDLMRNSSGAEVRAMSTALEKKNLASFFEKQFAKKQLLAEAEKAYWKLSLAREAVKINEELLRRSGKLYAWMKEKIGLNLMDKDDILLADSDLKYRELELVNAKDEEKSAARTLNALKGINSETLAEEVLSPEESALSTTIPSVRIQRYDIIALALNIEAGKASAEMKAEGVKPELSLSGAASLNSQSAGLNDTLSASFNTDHMVYGLNINLSVPLDLGERGKLIDGYLSEAKAGEKYLSQKTLEAEVEFKELVRKQEEVLKRLKLLGELESLQKRKADSEQDKLKKGNTVTYQVLMYEQDWAKSRLGVVQAKQGLVEILARLRLY